MSEKYPNVFNKPSLYLLSDNLSHNYHVLTLIPLHVMYNNKKHVIQNKPMLCRNSWQLIQNLGQYGDA